jgi:hypothetical protein
VTAIGVPTTGVAVQTGGARIVFALGPRSAGTIVIWNRPRRRAYLEMTPEGFQAFDAARMFTRRALR